MDFEHKPVLLNECIEGLDIKENGIYIDCTLGGAGHSKEICKNIKDGKLIGIDQDINAITAASENLKEFKQKTIIVHDNFVNLKQIAEDLQIQKVNGILIDLGVSSHQLDEEERGFSYMNDAPLDMRMDRRNEFSAKNVVNNYSEDKLIEIIRNYGEENWAVRIAKFIVEERKIKPIETTLELVNIIKKAVPKGARKDGPHPAKRTFQAIRIEVNKELDIIEQTIKDAVNLLDIGGRLCIITFHSLEDRIVKQTFKALENPCSCPRNFPICVCNKKKEVKIITKKPIVSLETELEENPRARSAKLRILEKVLLGGN